MKKNGNFYCNYTYRMIHVENEEYIVIFILQVHQNEKGTF